MNSIDEYLIENSFVINNPDMNPKNNYYNCVKLCNSNDVCTEEIGVKLEHDDQSFSMMHINCRSLLHNVPEMNVLLSIVQPTVLAVTETWLQEDIVNCIMYRPKYVRIHFCS